MAVFSISTAAQAAFDDYEAKKAIRTTDDGSLATQQAALTAAQQLVINTQASIASLTSKDAQELTDENTALTVLVNQLLADLKSQP